MGKGQDVFVQLHAGGPWLGSPQMLHAWGVMASLLELNWVQAFGVPVCASLGSHWGPEADVD